LLQILQQLLRLVDHWRRPIESHAYVGCRPSFSHIVPFSDSSEKFALSPGHTIVALKYLEDSGVEGVGRSCWSEEQCWKNTLDGMPCRSRACGAKRDGDFLPTSLWWANVWYASLAGGLSRKVITDHPGITGFVVEKKNELLALIGFSSAVGPKGPQRVRINTKNSNRLGLKECTSAMIPPSGSKVLEKPAGPVSIPLVERGMLGVVELTNVRPDQVNLIVCQMDRSGA
jgi:hypothetical protein